MDQRVKRGAALLDQKGPANWRNKIDRDRLNIFLPCDCIVGQLYGGFIKGLDALFGDAHEVSDDDVFEHGFSVESSRDSEQAFDRLTSAWLDYLKGTSQ